MVFAALTNKMVYSASGQNSGRKQMTDKYQEVTNKKTLAIAG
ncbi:MAG: hypothetical protein ACI9LL_000649 [Porticoccus sp.]|jgi:hypothetical protein